VSRKGSRSWSTFNFACSPLTSTPVVRAFLKSLTGLRVTATVSFGVLPSRLPLLTVSHVSASSKACCRGRLVLNF
jgi:hypothetical protein